MKINIRRIFWYLKTFAIAAPLFQCGVVKDLAGKKTVADAQAVVEARPENGCENCEPVTSPVDPTEIPIPEMSASLTATDSCEQVEVAIEEAIIARLNFEAEDAKQRFQDYHRKILQSALTSIASEERGLSLTCEPSSGAADSAGMESKSQPAPGPSDYSKTNNQVEDVEEGDILKSNGTHVFLIGNNRLHVMQTWPAEELTRLASIPFYDEEVTSMLFDDQSQLIIIGNEYPLPYERFYNGQRTNVTIVDISIPESPSIKDRFTIPGTYHSVRRVGDSVRLILRQGSDFYTSHLNWRVLNIFQNFDLTEEEYIARVDYELAKNVEATRQKTLAYWLKHDRYLHSQSGQEQVLENPTDCSRVYVPTTPSELGLTTVLSLHLKTKSISTTTLLTRANNVYANAKSLYFTTQYHWWRLAPEQRDVSYIHRFDTTDPNTVNYLGSGAVEGQVLNQFSMDEHQDFFRVATTVTRRIETTDSGQQPIWWRPFRQEVENALYVLKSEQGALKIVGEVNGIAKGERIFSARFDGEKGYLVTFRQVDPLFTLDLQDPYQPAIVGELKIDGVSNYIHLLDQNHLLTVGQGTGRRNSRITIFDVTDMRNPQQKHVFEIPNTYTNANWDHKAFTFLRSKGLLTIPVTGWRNTSGSWWDNWYSAVMAFKIDAQTGIEHVGELGMADIFQSNIQPSWGWWLRRANVYRSFIADDFVYAVSNFGMRTANVADLSTPVATSLFSETSR